MPWYKMLKKAEEKMYGYWVLPSGKAINCENEFSHFETLKNTEVGKAYYEESNFSKEIYPGAAYKMAWDRGYAKITMPYYGLPRMQIEFRNKLTMSQIAFISKLINELAVKYNGECYFSIYINTNFVTTTTNPKEAIIKLH